MSVIGVWRWRPKRRRGDAVALPRCIGRRVHRGRPSDAVWRNWTMTQWGRWTGFGPRVVAVRMPRGRACPTSVIFVSSAAGADSAVIRCDQSTRRSAARASRKLGVFLWGYSIDDQRDGSRSPWPGNCQPTQVGMCSAGASAVCLAAAHVPLPEAGYRLGSDRGSPNHGSTLFSKRVMAQIRSPVRVRT